MCAPAFLRHSRIETYLTALALVLLLAGGAALRLYVADKTTVDTPYRVDAADYYNYAYNLRHYGVYSRDGRSVFKRDAVPYPDAVRSPGYPLFLALFAKSRPAAGAIRRITWWQALLSALLIPAAFGIFAFAASSRVALIPAGLTAISPHLVNINVYLLSEWLFALLLAAAFLMLGVAGRWRERAGLAALGAGLLFGAATLTRPVLELFLPLLLTSMAADRTTGPRWRPVVLLAAGCALVFVPWLVRNYQATGRIHDSHLVIGTLVAGMYPDLMYKDNAASLGVPYRFDPHAAGITKSVSSALEAMAGRFGREPRRELRWYLFGKPVTLWSWNLIGGAGDVFAYDVLATPYARPGFLRLTHALMYGLHWLLVVLALLASIAVWLPGAHRQFRRSGLFLLRAISLLLFYNTALLMIGAPYPRYSIPLLPMIFGMAGVAASVLAQEAAKRRRVAAAAAGEAV